MCGEVASAARTGKGEEQGRGRRQKQTAGSWGGAKACRRCIVSSLHFIALQCSAFGLPAKMQSCNDDARLPPSYLPLVHLSLPSPETMPCLARQSARARHSLLPRLVKVP
jgi:hypothetical protein